MKNTLIILSFVTNAGNNKTDKTKEAIAQEWMKNQPWNLLKIM